MSTPQQKQGDSAPTDPAYFTQMNAKQNLIEFTRYKQDCRKRAMEMAHSELMNLTAATRGEKGWDINLTKLADKYYKWLIDIS